MHSVEWTQAAVQSAALQWNTSPAIFFTLESKKTWTIPLPTCLNCKPQLPTVSAA
jgi:hypothetical protein